MDLSPTSCSAPLIEPLVTLTACDGYVVHVTDPHTHEAGAHGPYDGWPLPMPTTGFGATSTSADSPTSGSP
jgi:hypothetical protein